MSYATGVTLVVIGAGLWSLMGLAIRLVDDADTWSILFWRSAGMVPVLLGFIAWRSGGRVMARMRRAGTAGIVGGLALIVTFAAAIFALQSTTVANASFLFAASPFFSAVFARLALGETVRRATWLSIGIAAIGMFIMVREGLAAGALAGNAAALVSAMGFACFTVALRWGRLEDMMPAVVLGGVFSSLVAAAVLAAQGATPVVSAQDIAVSIGMGAVILAIGMILYTLGSQVLPAAELALLCMVESLLAPVWVWLILGETASPGIFLGGAIITAAVATNAVSGIRRKPLAPPVP